MTSFMYIFYYSYGLKIYKKIQTRTTYYILFNYLTELFNIYKKEYFKLQSPHKTNKKNSIEKKKTICRQKETKKFVYEVFILFIKNFKR